MNLPEFDQSFLDVLDSAFADHAERVCTVFGGETLTYAQVDEQSARVANALLGAGFKPGMKGAVYALNSALGFVATIGIIRAGGVWIPVNPRNSTADNVATMLQFECQAIFYQELFSSPVNDVRRDAEAQPLVICMDSEAEDAPWLEDWLQGASAKAPQVDMQSSDLISIPLTGGTTGMPKGVMLTHSNFCALDYGARSLMAGRSDATWLCAAPMTHVGGRIALANMSAGSKFVILEKVDLQEILETIQSDGVTDMFLPPTAIYTLLDQPNLSDFDLSSLKQLGYGSAPMSIDRLKEALRVLGPVMAGGFGQTECPMYISALRPEDHFVDGQIAPDKRLSSVGRATPISELGILDEEGRELAAGEVGEIVVKGPMVSLGYYGNPEETSKIRRDGWHLTGDIGYLDEDGFLYICDRKKDMIITGGFNVYSAEVENALMSMPGIKMAVVIGAPSEKWGEEVTALIQTDGDVELTVEQMIADAKQRLGSVKAPKRIEIVEDFPRTPIGKIDKKAIRARYWKGQGRSI